MGTPARLALLAACLIPALTLAARTSAPARPTQPSAPQTRPSQTRPAESRPSTAPAQSAPADLQVALRELTAPATHDQALTRLKAMPESAIIPLWDYCMDSAQPATLRRDVRTALDDIYQRAREARIPQINREAAAWPTTSLIDAYKKVTHDPKIDPLVLQAFNDFNANSPNLATSVKAALDAGSTDPEIRLLYISRDPRETGPNTSLAAMRELEKITADFEHSSYPASRKLLAYQYYLDRATLASCPPEIPRETKVRALDRIIAFFPDFLKEKLPRYVMRNSRMGLYVHAISVFNNLGFSGERPRKAAFDHFYPPLIKALPDDPRIIYLEAVYYKDLAWDGRGDGFANTVTENGWKLFSERLDLAAASAEKGWRLDPLDPSCASLMITICMGKGFGKDTMEIWFSRALAAEPRSFDACSRKMTFLLPKWGGSEREVLEFGRWCVANGDGDNGLPIILVRAHENLRNYVADPSTYMYRPEVWADYQSAYEKLLADKARLQSNRNAYLIDRSNYILAATNCHQWKEAKQLMDQFGEEIDLPALGGKAPYDYLKRKAATEAAK